MRCSNCGADNDDDAVFCLKCDHFLEWEVTQRRRRPADRSARSPNTGDPAQRLESRGKPQPTPDRPGPVTEMPSEPASAHEIIRALDAGRELAVDRSRHDLTEHLDNARERLAAASATVVVLGEFKRGKSTLINALLHTAVCPVDADVVTAIPTVVCYGETAGVTAYAEDSASGEILAREVPLRELPQLVSEPAGTTARPLERSVEVRVPHRMLRAGLRLVDTPGVGGLDSGHGYLTLGTLAMADGAIFVADASQELTGPELAFLTSVLGRCPQTTMVVTKTDLFPDWRRVVDLDRRHLANAGLDVPVFAVSSFLRLRAATDESLNAESGFEELVEHLARTVVRPGGARAASAAAQEVDFVVTQLAEKAEAERTVLEQPARAPEVIARLRESTDRAATLAGPSSSWQQMLADGIQDLVADVDHDLQERMRGVVRDAEAIIDQGDPKDLWPETELWLRRQVAQVAVENRNLLIARASQLTSEVAGRFELDAGRQFELSLGTADRSVSELPEIGPLGAQPGRIASMLLATRSSIYVPMVLFSVLSGIGWVAIGVGVAVVLGAGIGQKVIRDETKRQRTFRQQQAKVVARRFVDDVAFVLNKDTRDALRATQRRLREDFQSRASSMHVSSQLALEAAETAATLDRKQQTERAAELAAEERQLAGLRMSARRLAGAGVKGDG